MLTAFVVLGALVGWSICTGLMYRLLTTLDKRGPENFKNDLEVLVLAAVFWPLVGGGLVLWFLMKSIIRPFLLLAFWAANEIPKPPKPSGLPPPPKWALDKLEKELKEGE